MDRPTLSQSTHSVLDRVLACKESEVTVIADSGKPKPSAGWQHSDRYKLSIHLNLHNRSEAHNTGAVIARRKYLQFAGYQHLVMPSQGVKCLRYGDLDSTTNCNDLFGHDHQSRARTLDAASFTAVNQRMALSE